MSRVGLAPMAGADGLGAGVLLDKPSRGGRRPRYVARAELVLAQPDQRPLGAVGLDPDPLGQLAEAFARVQSAAGEHAELVMDVVPVPERGGDCLAGATLRFGQQAQAAESVRLQFRVVRHPGGGQGLAVERVGVRRAAGVEGEPPGGDRQGADCRAQPRLGLRGVGASLEPLVGGVQGLGGFLAYRRRAVVVVGLIQGGPSRSPAAAPDAHQRTDGSFSARVRTAAGRFRTGIPADRYDEAHR